MRKIDYSIVIPAHNEEKNIEGFVGAVAAVVKKLKLSAEIIVVNDASHDSTGKILDKIAKRKKLVSVIHRDSKPGPGNAERAGFKVSKGKWVITLDSDFSHDPKEIPAFIKKAKDGYDMVIGSRFFDKGKMKAPLLRIVLSRFGAIFAKIITSYPLSDVTSGYRIMTRSSLMKINPKSEWFEIHTEIPIRYHLLGYKIAEVPIIYRKRKAGKTKLAIFKAIPSYLGVILKEKIRIG